MTWEPQKAVLEGYPIDLNHVMLDDLPALLAVAKQAVLDDHPQAYDFSLRIEGGYDGSADHVEWLYFMRPTTLEEQAAQRTDHECQTQQRRQQFERLKKEFGDT